MLDLESQLGCRGSSMVHIREFHFMILVGADPLTNQDGDNIADAATSLPWRS